MGSPSIALGAALEFTQEELGGPCTENESFPVCQTTSTSLVNGNGDRVGLIIINLGANTVNVSVSSSVTANTGITLPPAGGSISMTVRDDFTLPSRNWWGIATGGTSQVYVLEIARYRKVLP